MDRKRTRGRQKISIAKIEKENDCFATFSKRRIGLFKKAGELSTLCSVDIAVLIFSPTGKPFSFFHPSMESVLTRFRNPDWQPDDPTRLVEACSRARVLQLNEMVDRVGEGTDAERERERLLEEARNRTGRALWWEEPVEEMGKERVAELIGLLQNLQLQIGSRREKILKKLPAF